MSERRLDDTLELRPGLTLRNRLAATAHGRAAVVDGVPGEADAEYWARVADGGIAMCIAGGTVIGPFSTQRGRILTEAYREDVVDGMRVRAEAMKSGGAVACLQILHLGRETLGAEIYYHPIAPSAVRSPREPNAPRALTDAELDEIVEGFRISAEHAVAAGFDAVELHAAHGYLLGQLLSPVANRRPGAETLEGRMEPVMRIARAVREVGPELALGIRLSVGDPQDAGLDVDDTVALVSKLDPAIDYVNLTAGMRADYVRDMGTSRPPLLDQIAELRRGTERTLLVSHGFRDPVPMSDAVAAGADVVGMARALIADPDLPRKVLAGETGKIRPCVACNEDCRTFDPALLCTVNPDLAAPGDAVRRAQSLLRGAALDGTPGRVAIVGAGPAGLEAALALQDRGIEEIVLFDAADRVGGTAALAARSPSRDGWARIVEFYARNLDPGRVEQRLGIKVGAADVADFDTVVVATGAVEHLPEAAAGAMTVSQLVAAGVERLEGRDHVVVVDDGFAWWPHAMAVELAAVAGVGRITLVTPGVAFAMGIPGEGRVQMLKRLRGKLPLAMRPLHGLVGIGFGDGRVEIRSAAGESETLSADAVVVVGERRPRTSTEFESLDVPVLIIGDAITPRRVAHAISEGRAAAAALSGSAEARKELIPARL
ncbi:MAG TPA: NAD(P)-binding protein [Solirubrobacterales bacterium]|nr:NAD(P)-binding protein [Solirubrobacterales bacterium]